MLGATTDFGLLGVARGTAFIEVPELPLDADDCWACVVAGVSVEGVDSSIDGRGEK